MNLFPPSNSASAQAPQNSYYVPIVIESDGRGERSFDIYSRLLKDRIIFITTPIDDGVAASVIAQLLFLQMQDPKKGHPHLHQLPRRFRHRRPRDV